MASIRKLIENPPTDREIAVEWKGETYRVKGRPNAQVIGKTLYLPEDERLQRARHWKAVIGEGFDAETVGRVLLLQAVLQPETGEPPYDETEVARLAVSEEGMLFLALVGAALQVVGLAGDAKEKAGESYGPTAVVAVADPKGGAPDGPTSSGTA